MLFRSAHGLTTRYIYNADGNLVQTVYPHQYNPANDNLDISGGVNEYTDSTIGEIATYDENGNVLTYTDSFGKTTVNTYDSESSKLGYSYFHVLHGKYSFKNVTHCSSSSSQDYLIHKLLT